MHIAMPFEKDGTKGYTQTNRQIGYVIACTISSFFLKKKGVKEREREREREREGEGEGEGEREDQTNKIRLNSEFSSGNFPLLYDWQMVEINIYMIFINNIYDILNIIPARSPSNLWH